MTATEERSETPGAEPARPPEAAPAATDGAPPRLADGVELAGLFEDSGYEDPPSIVRRADGQVVQLPGLLYAVLEAIDGRRTYDELASEVSERVGRGLAAADVQMLVEEKLRPLGVLALADGSSPELQKVDPLLALRLRVALVPERATQAIASVLRPLFLPPVLAVVLAGLVAFDVWLFGVHGVGQALRSALYQPLWMIGVVGLIALGTAWHELGHATALRYGGGRPGAMGAGIYVVWPAFYTDVTDAYRLGRGGRIRTDLGGVYFNAIFVLALGAAFVATGLEPILLAAVLVHLQVLQQFMPFLRLDGYYVVSDLTGVPDLFGRIKPTLKGMLPGRGGDPLAEQLKPWVRRVTTAWVLLTIPVVLLVFGLLVFNAPRMLATAWDSFLVQADEAEAAIGDGDVLTAGASGLRALVLALPTLGMAYTFSRIGWRGTAGVWSWSQDSPLRRLAAGAALVALAGVAAYVLLPNGDYRPIQPGERGTLQGGLSQFASAGGGRPGLTVERERELGEIVVERERRDTGTSEEPGGEPPAGETEPVATTPTKTVPTDTVPTEPVPTDTVPTETVPTETTPTGTTPTETAPPQTSPAETSPAATTPTETTPTGTATTGTATTETTPGETAPTETSPTQTTTTP